MFDPAALLIKTIGLALPVEAANGPAGKLPGESADVAGNGGFAGLLALKLEGAEPAVAVPGAAQLAAPPAVSLVTTPPRPTAATDEAAKSLPATGNILPPALPSALPNSVPEAVLTAFTPVKMPTPAPAKVTAHAPVQVPVQIPAQASAQASVRTAVLPAPVAPTTLRKAPTSSASVETAAVPNPAAKEVELGTPQAAPAAAVANRRAAHRVALAVAAVLTEANDVTEAAQQAPAPPAAMQPALPAVTAKPRPAATRSAKPEAPDAATPEQNEPAKEEGAPIPADLALAAPMIPAPLAAAVVAQAHEPVAVEFAPSPAPATSGKVPLAAASAPRTDIAVPVPQADAAPAPAPAPAMAAQVRVAMRLPAEAGREEGGVSQSAAPAHRAEEIPFEAALPAASRAIASPASLPPAVPVSTHGHVAAQALTTVEAPADFAQIVDRLVAARDAVAPAEVRVTIDHAQFGKVSVGFTPEASGMNVTLAAADPEFARAVEAAAPFAPPATSEAPQVTASSPARGGDLPSTFTGQQGQQSQQSGRQQPAGDPRGGSAQANPSNRTPDSEARGTRGRGIFA